MRRLLALLVALLTLFGRPGAGEMLENVAHAAVEGHAAHSAHSEADEHGPMHLEHGCGGGAHVCVCHAPTLATMSTRVFLPLGPSETHTLAPLAAERVALRGFSSGVYRPPAS